MFFTHINKFKIITPKTKYFILKNKFSKNEFYLFLYNIKFSKFVFDKFLFFKSCFTLKSTSDIVITSILRKKNSKKNNMKLNYKKIK